MGKEVVRISIEEWRKQGAKLFGEDMLHWYFKCPACGHIQCPEDFRKYKDKGAEPDSANHKCVGRYDGHGDVPMWSGKSPCNYTAYGLLNICPVLVIKEDGTEIRSFGFAEEKASQ